MATHAPSTALVTPTVTSAAPGSQASCVAGAGLILKLIRDGVATSRGDIVRQTGLARSTVAQRIGLLEAHQLVLTTGGTTSTGGRPPVTLTFNRQAGVVLAAALDAHLSRLAVTDLAGTPLAQVAERIDAADGPAAVLTFVDEQFEHLLAEVRRGPEDVRGVGIGVPGPVAVSAGRPIASPIPGEWDDFSIPGWFAGRYPGPVLVDDVVNLMALAERTRHWPRVEHLLFVSLGASISCGVVAGGRIMRGAHGAAGDIAHIPIAGHDHLPCRCGGTGCLEAVAGGRALAGRLAAQGVAATGPRDVVGLVRSRHPLAVHAVRDAGRRLGEVLAVVVELFGPSVIVLGGELGEAHEPLVAGVRELTFQHARPHVTRDLLTVPSRLGERGALLGTALMVVEHTLAPEAVDRALEAAGAYH